MRPFLSKADRKGESSDEIHASIRWQLAVVDSLLDFICRFGGRSAVILARSDQFHPRPPDWLRVQRVEARLSDDLFGFYRFFVQRTEFGRIPGFFRCARRGSG